MPRTVRFCTSIRLTNLAKASPKVKLAAFAGVFGAYWLSFPWLLAAWGMPSRIFALSYIVLAALLWGLKGGLLVALVNIPVVLSLLKILGVEYIGTVVAPVVTLTMAVIVGRLTDLSLELEAQYVQSSQAARALQEYRKNLEQLVQERTAELAHANTTLQEQIVRRIEMEDELLRARKIESLGVLAGGIAHDFNNILNIIMSCIFLAKMGGDQPAATSEALTQAVHACQRAADLARQLLTFAQGGAPIRQTAALTELISESVSLALRGSNVRCDLSMPPDLWLVDVDTGQMSQVINNLLINAIQAMPEGGVIKIRAANRLVGVAPCLPLPEGRYVNLTVTDAGCGIPAAQLEKIFDPYFTTKPTGSGLGLAVAYAIIKKHEGHITVASTLGVGTTFSLYLPASQNPTPPGPEATESPRTGQGKILLMDDDDMIRELTRTLLTQLGYEVESAADGSEAIALYASAQAANQPFVAVILDLTIPGGMGGKAVVGQLLDIDPQVKAIASSGYSNDPVLANFRQYGFSGVLAKPYTIAELSTILQRVIHS